MIDSLIKIAEKCTELLHYREQQRERNFKALIEPMYEQLTIVHKNYLHIFNSIGIKLTNRVPLQEIIEELGTLRIEHEAYRRSIFGQAENLGQAFPNYEKFFLSVQMYCHGAPGESCVSPASSLEWRLLRLVERRIVQQNDGSFPADATHRRQARVYLNEVQARLRADWDRLVVEYSKLLGSHL